MSNKSPRHRPWLKRPDKPHRDGGPGDGRRAVRSRQGPSPDRALLYGAHAAAAALANPARVIRSVLATATMAERLAEALAARGIEPEMVEPRDLDRRLGADAVHQGILIEAEPLPEPDLDTLCAPRGPGALPPLLLVLDQVTDPHNVGALLRSSAVFGVEGMIMTRHHSPPLSGVLAKAASGALEHVPVTLVTNLARALEQLEELGVIRIGLDGDSPTPLETYAVAGPTALVMGAEGHGLRRLTRENCDVLCRISTFGAMRSLNVSNAAAVALHTLRTRAGAPPS